jgi:hypothetical protein
MWPIRGAQRQISRRIVSLILDAAKLKIAPASAFDLRRIMEYLIGKAERAAIALIRHLQGVRHLRRR